MPSMFMAGHTHIKENGFLGRGPRDRARESSGGRDGALVEGDDRDNGKSKNKAKTKHKKKEESQDRQEENVSLDMCYDPHLYTHTHTHTPHVTPLLSGTHS
eukprot:GHVR01114463.1.p2 GENE.GHVR01114463.1~~GHVR01114463.1.p2  ORF type:complete len:101 (+),score=41.15 GHVR01114463.1:150-452(+)